jgi:hypothetical protein
MNLHVYPNYNPAGQDHVPEYCHHLPLNGIDLASDSRLTLCNPDEADFFYMGQFGDHQKDFFEQPRDQYYRSFPYLENKPERHIFNKCGDWVYKELPEWLHSCIITTHNIKAGYHHKNFYIYVCQSRPFISLMERKDRYGLPDNRSFGFQGYPDPFGTRVLLQQVFQSAPDIESEYNLLNSAWSYADPESDIVRSYHDVFLRNAFAVCPQGGGVDSIRLFEACFFGRVPVMVSHAALPGEDYYDTSFLFKISTHLPVDAMAYRLRQIAQTPWHEMEQRGQAARAYFDAVIRPQMRDPTGDFIQFLSRRRLTN